MATAITNAPNTTTDTTYYHENDRWNGNEYIGATKSFWEQYQTALTNAIAVNTDTTVTTQTAVDAATANLTAAIAKLIPKTEVNATLLYELVKEETETYPKTESNYTKGTWQVYSEKLLGAQTILNGLYGLLGDASVSKQQTVDNAKTALIAARNDLLSEDRIEEAIAYNEIITQLEKLFPQTENNGKYTAASWQAFTEVKAKIPACREEHPLNGSLTNTGANLYRSLAASYWDAAYNLEETADAKVSISFSDDMSMRHPAYAKTNMAAYSDTLTLTNDKTLKALVQTAGLDQMTDWLEARPSLDSNIAAGYLVYVNGVLLRYPGKDMETGGYSIEFYDMSGYSVRDWADVKLCDGDQVTICRYEFPQRSTYQQPEGVPFQFVTDGFAQLSVAAEGALSAEEGKTLTATVTSSKAYLGNYDGKSQPRSGMKLAAYGPKNEDGSYPATPIIAEGVTNAEGEGQITLYTAGEYRISAFDPRENDYDSLFFPSLSIGANTLEATVTSLSAEDLEGALDGYMTRLDQLFAGYDRSKFTKSQWNQMQSIYYTAKAAIVNADSMGAAQAALKTAEAGFEELAQAAESRTAMMLDNANWFFDRLPTADQVEQGLFDQGDVPLYRNLVKFYTVMSDDQKGQLTTAQIAAYNAMTAAYGSDGSGLSAAKYYDLTIRCVPQSNGAALNYLNESVSKWSSMNFSEILNNTEDHLDLQHINNEITTLDQGDDTQKVLPGAGIMVNLQRIHLLQGYNVAKIECEGATLTRETDISLDTWVFKATTLMPRNDVTITIYLRSDEDVDGAISVAKDALTDAYKGYSKEDYTAANWADLDSAYRNGLAKVEAAASIAEVTTAKDNALAAMKAVEKRADGDFGSVSVEIYNTTYNDGLGYHAMDSFVSGDHTLSLNDTMMSIVTDTLKDKGYGVTGSASYISGIYRDLNNNGKFDEDTETILQEFDNGPNSGWMGTLNDWFTNEGFNSFYVASTNANTQIKDGDVIKIMYSSTGYGNDLGGSWGNADTSLKALTLENAALQTEFDGATTSYMATLDDSLLDKLFGKKFSITPTAANKNYQVRIFLNDKTGTNWYRPGEAIPAEAGDVIYIGVGDRAWPSMNKQGAEAINYTGTWYAIYLNGEGDKAVQNAISLIDALPAASAVTTADKDAVNFADTYLKSLSTADQAKVTNSAKLTALLKQLAALDEIQDVIDLIAALPGADAVTLGDAEAINAASAAYDGLTDSQKATMQLMYTEKLTAVKAALTALGYKDYSAYQTALTNVLSYIQTTVTNPTCGSTDGEWAALALARGNITNDDWYNLYLANLKAHVKDCDGVLHTKKYTEYSRVVLALTSLGMDASAFDTGDKVYDLVTPLLDKQKNGEYWATWQGNNGTCFALMALDSANYLPNAGKEVRAALIDSLKANQLADGGWAINSSTSGFGVDVTAMVLQSLAPYYQDKAKFEALGAKTTYNELKAMVNKAVANMKNYTGNSYGSVEAAAQVVVALSTLGIDAEGADWEAVTAILSYYDADVHGFRHTSDGTVNQMATEQAAYALVAYDRYTKEQNSLYDMTDKFTATPDVVYTDDQKAAMAVTDNIEALPETIALGDEEAITAARAAYDTLTKEQKKLVDSITLTNLQNAEKALAQLKAAAADEAAAKVVADQIAALPGDITLDSKAAVEAARAAYDKLNDAQKALVTNLDTLTAAEATIKALTDEQEGVDKMTDVVKGKWYYDDVAYCVAKGIIFGTSDTTFNPDDNITRGQFVTLLGRYMGVKGSSAEAPVQTKFSDVDATKYYASHVAWATENGITSGTSESTFEPNAFISRQDMATMIRSFAKVAGITLPDGSSVERFADDGEIADYAKEAVYSMKAAKIISGKGDNAFAPNDNATRAEAAKIIHLLLEMK